MGKYCMYNADGTYLLNEGLYEGKGNCKTKIEIASYMQKISREVTSDKLEKMPDKGDQVDQLRQLEMEKQRSKTKKSKKNVHQS